LDHITQKINFGTWEISADNGVDKVTVSAYAPKEKFMDLQFMTPEGKIFHDMETLTGHVTVKIYQGNLLGWKLIDTLTSEYAGIEYGDWKL
jgi:hypothetical protein